MVFSGFLLQETVFRVLTLTSWFLGPVAPMKVLSNPVKKKQKISIPLKTIGSFKRYLLHILNHCGLEEEFCELRGFFGTMRLLRNQIFDICFDVFI